MKKLSTGHKITRDGQIYAPSGKLISTTKHHTGYLVATLCFSGKKKQFRVHRLVAEAYINNPYNKPYVCHKNGNKLDNRVENLYFGTPLENSADRKAHGFSLEGELNPKAKLNSIEVEMIRHILNLKQYSQWEIANAFGVNAKTINRINRNKSWKNPK